MYDAWCLDMDSAPWGNAMNHGFKQADHEALGEHAAARVRAHTDAAPRAPTTGGSHLRLLATLVVTVFAPTLAAQAPINSPIPVPLADGAYRRLDLEQEAGSDGHSLLIYQWDSPVEIMSNFYIQRMGAERDHAVDSVKVRPNGVSNLSYHMTFWSLQDECADSATAAGTTAPCTHWRRAKDLSKTLHRRAVWTPGLWVQSVTFTWYSRDQQGSLTRWTAEVLDSGVAKDWKSYEPTSELVIRGTGIKDEPSASPPPQ
jgi:hypothetical protein